MKRPDVQTFIRWLITEPAGDHVVHHDSRSNPPSQGSSGVWSSWAKRGNLNEVDVWAALPWKDASWSLLHLRYSHIAIASRKFWWSSHFLHLPQACRASTNSNSVTTMKDVLGKLVHLEQA